LYNYLEGNRGGLRRERRKGGRVLLLIGKKEGIKKTKNISVILSNIFWRSCQDTREFGYVFEGVFFG